MASIRGKLSIPEPAPVPDTPLSVSVLVVVVLVVVSVVVARVCSIARCKSYTSSKAALSPAPRSGGKAWAASPVYCVVIYVYKRCMYKCIATVR